MYVKKFDAEGNVTNPITKENPFTNSPIGKEKMPKTRRCNNTRGVRCIVAKIGLGTFVKYAGFDQIIGNKRIQHLRAV